jgi:hypothetical protein
MDSRNQTNKGRLAKAVVAHICIARFDGAVTAVEVAVAKFAIEAAATRKGRL